MKILKPSSVMKGSLIVKLLPCLVLLISACASAQISKPSKAQPQRIVVVGDVHGDAKQLKTQLRQAGLIDRRQRWAGGDSVLVQLGDLTDRGPDSLKAIRLLQGLNEQASKQGGHVEVLVGNHEMMNVIGDLRYVHEGEYKAFRDANSKARQNAYYEQVKAAELAAVKEGEATPEFDREHRKAFNAEFPLGYVEHRLAWQATGDLGKWVLENKTVAKIGDTLFVHAGVSQAYKSMTISEINTRVRTALIDPVPSEDETLIIDDQQGPLWYRGWARLAETPENHQALDEVLAAFSVQRMVIAHTPLLPTVLPRFDGKILMVDVGMAKHYGSGTGVLEILPSGLFVRHADEMVEIPTNQDKVLDYLNQVAELTADSERIRAYAKKLSATQADSQTPPEAQEKTKAAQ